MKVFDLRFTSCGAMRAAFQRAQDLEVLTSCTLEPEVLRMRFVAPDEDADELAHRIYLDGGLRWCSGHALASASP